MGGRQQREQCLMPQGTFSPQLQCKTLEDLQTCYCWGSSSLSVCLCPLPSVCCTMCFHSGFEVVHRPLQHSMRFAFFHQVQALWKQGEKCPRARKRRKKEIIPQYTGGKGKKNPKEMTRERQGGIKDQVGGRTSAKGGGGSKPHKQREWATLGHAHTRRRRVQVFVLICLL